MDRRRGKSKYFLGLGKSTVLAKLSKFSKLNNLNYPPESGEQVTDQQLVHNDMQLL